MHLTAASGKPVAVQALERPGFDLKLPPASADHVAYWSEQQIELADKPCRSVPSDIHMLIGADKANELLIERCVVDNQSVWKTELGWIISGPGENVPKKEKTMAVGFVQSQVELLWQMEEPLPVEHGEDLPAFPIRQLDGKYEIGLLWKTDERPAGNRVLWDVDDDLLSVDVSNAVQPDWTKRNLLQTVASVYDPLGLVAPVVMSGKILLQKA